MSGVIYGRAIMREVGPYEDWKILGIYGDS